MKRKGKLEGKHGREEIVLRVWWRQPRFEY